MSHKTLTWMNESNRTVYAQAWAPDTEPTDLLILVHGLGEHSGRYEDWAARFVQKNIAVYALDLHGHGRSTGIRGHTDSFAHIYEDIQFLVSSARRDYPGAKIHLYGHSMGGAICLGFVFFRAKNSMSSGLSSLIVTGAAIRPGFEPPIWKLKLAALLDKVIPRLTLGNELDPNWLSNNHDVVSKYKSDPLVHDRISVRWYNEWLRAVQAIRSHGIRLSVPVFMLHGSGDQAVSPSAAEELSKLIEAKFQIFQGAYHELHHEPCQDDVFNDIMAWLDDLP